MIKYIEYKNDIFIPIQKVEVSFHEKEDIALSVFQKFILEAIDLGYTINKIAEATLLSKNVIETEIIQMVSQKLLIREEERFVLSDLSKKLQMISQSIINLNNEKKTIYIDLMTGDLQAYDQDTNIYDKNDQGLFMYPKLSEKSLDGISLEDNINFFGNYMESFAGVDEFEVENILNSVFVVFETVGKRQYIKKRLSRLPYEIVGEGFKVQNKDFITVKGLKYQIEYQLEYAYEDIISELFSVKKFDENLLSEKALSILKDYDNYKRTGSQKFYCVYDTTSGKYCFRKESLSENAHNTRYNLELPILYELTEDIKNSISKELRENYNISENYILKESECNSLYYILNCELTDLWGDDYVEC